MIIVIISFSKAVLHDLFVYYMLILYVAISYNPQIQIFAESETKRPFFECSFKTKRTKKDLRTTQTTKPEIRAKTALFRALSKAI